jgi:hypothetical protein
MTAVTAIDLAANGVGDAAQNGTPSNPPETEKGNSSTVATSSPSPRQ